LEEKIITYARNGIPEYWIVDLVNNKVRVYTQPQNERYSQITEYFTGIITPQAFPQVQIRLDLLLLF
jgi:Uma2 family endonuclease